MTDAERRHRETLMANSVVRPPSIQACVEMLHEMADRARALNSNNVTASERGEGDWLVTATGRGLMRMMVPLACTDTQERAEFLRECFDPRGLAAALDLALFLLTWRSMDSAPKDGTRIRVWHHSWVGNHPWADGPVAKWFEPWSSFVLEAGSVGVLPELWIPLLPPPAPSGERP